jgi:uncharacterized RDD family membrane protein YckC
VTAAPAESAPAPAGFWRRSVAYGIDWLLLALALCWLVWPMLADAWAAIAELHGALQDWLVDKMLAGTALPAPMDLAHSVLADPRLHELAYSAMARLTVGLLQASTVCLVAAAIYFIGFEASRWQATPGKRLLGLRVRDLAGRPIGLPQSAARFVAGSVSWLSLNLGHALAGWRSDGRALHDLIAGTRVDRDAGRGDQTSI